MKRIVLIILSMLFLTPGVLAQLTCEEANINIEEGSEFTVNVQDLILISLAFGLSEGDLYFNEVCDVNNDNDINVIDLALVSVNIGCNIDLICTNTSENDYWVSGEFDCDQCNHPGDDDGDQNNIYWTMADQCDSDCGVVDTTILYGDFQDIESSCSDGIDNDCDGESDHDSQDGRHGDSDCPVSITGISVSQKTPNEDNTITVSCESSVAGVNSILAGISSTCTYLDCSGSSANFTCTDTSGTPFTITISYDFGVACSLVDWDALASTVGYMACAPESCTGGTVDFTCTENLGKPINITLWDYVGSCASIDWDTLASALVSPCTWSSWVANDANFACNTGDTTGLKMVGCYVNRSRSYKAGSEYLSPIRVYSSDCVGHDETYCNNNPNCEWCPSCNANNQYSGGIDRCVDAGNCVYSCEADPVRCGASCDLDTVGCPDTECDDLDGCYSGTLRDYSDEFNDCQTDCSCESNSCTSYSETGTDDDGDGYDAECGDCDDDPLACGSDCYTGATELCDGYDNDCDGETDEGFDEETCYALCTYDYNDVVRTGELRCCGDDANEGNPYQFSETSCSDGNDNDCDGKIDFDDPDCSGLCTDSGENDYFVLGQPDCNQCNHEGDDDGDQDDWSHAMADQCDSDCGTVSTTVQPVNYHSTELCDGYDNDCDGETDEGFDEETCYALCTYDYNDVVRTGELRCCGDDANEGNPYQFSETSCSDGNDNDCDGKIDFDDPDCSGVCGNTGESDWFVVGESDCNQCDHEGDEDGNSQSDYDDMDGLHGDEACPVTLTHISVSDMIPDEYTTVNVFCTPDPHGVNSIIATLGGTPCTFTEWAGSSAKFSCDTGAAGAKTIVCTIDATKSYQSGPDQTTGVIVQSVLTCGDTGEDDYYVAGQPDCNQCDHEGDEDGNSQSDYDDMDGLHGDEACPVAIEGMSVSDTTPDEYTTIDVYCTPDIYGVNSVEATLGGISCTFTDWVDSDAQFSCDTGAAGTKTAVCGIDTAKSYQSGSDQTRSVDVQTSTGGNSCSSCADCTSKIQSASLGDTIQLTADITYSGSGNCIDFDGTDGVTFDCNGHSITGGGSLEGVGIALTSGSDNNVVRNCPSISNLNRGIDIDSSDSNSFSNIVSNNNHNGIELAHSDYTTFDGIQTAGSHGSNIIIIQCVGTDMTDIHSTDAHSAGSGCGLTITRSSITLTDSHISNNDRTISFFSVDAGDGTSYIYNNVFDDNAEDIYIWGSGSAPDVVWNVPLDCGAGPNIVGGSCMGGNLWGNPAGSGFSDTCTDSDTDGICDSGHTLTSGGYEAGTDNYPLVAESSTMTTCNSCADCTSKIQSASPGDTIQLSNSILDIGDIYCIDFGGADGVTFDCDSHYLRGTSELNGRGINLASGSDGNAVRNCPEISRFEIGINIHSSFGNTIENVQSYSNGQYGLVMTYSGSNTVRDSTLFSNNIEDFRLFSNSALKCTNSLENVDGSGGRPIGLYNSAVDLQDQVFSTLVLCDADDSELNNVDIQGSASYRNNGFYMQFTDNAVISGMDSNSNYGILVEYSNHNHFYDMTVTDSGWYGIYMYESDFNDFQNCQLTSTRANINAHYSDYNEFTGMTLSGNFRGINIYESGGITLRDSEITDCSSAGVAFWDVDSSYPLSYIYNNVFDDNTRDVYLSASSPDVVWNVPLDCGAGPNILGGSCMGGNFWGNSGETGFSDTCTDSDTDGICDSGYTITSGQIDNLPLTDEQTGGEICGNGVDDDGDQGGWTHPMADQCDSDCGPVLTTVYIGGGYQVQESSCSDGLDNDCNGRSDYDSQDGLPGDYPACAVSITDMSVSDKNPDQSSSIALSCTSSVYGINSVVAGITPQCTYVECSGNTANFTCTDTNSNPYSTTIEYDFGGACNLIDWDALAASAMLTPCGVAFCDSVTGTVRFSCTESNTGNPISITFWNFLSECNRQALASSSLFNPCSFTGWSGNDANFNCNTGTAGLKYVGCYIDPSRSYDNGEYNVQTISVEALGACTDIDGDGYGDPASEYCTYPQLDCDDGDPSVNPGAIKDDCDDGVDEDCSGSDEVCLVTMPETYPTIISDHSCVKAYNDRIYCFGGLNYSNSNIMESYSDAIVEYNPATGTATTLSTRMPYGANKLSCAPNAAGSRIYCFGGYAQDLFIPILDYKRDIFEFNVNTQGATVRISEFPYGIEGLSCEESGGFIYCFGGATDGPTRINTIYRYSPTADTLSLLPVVLPSPNHLLSCTENPLNGRIYCFGGIDDVPSMITEILEFNPSTNGLTIKSAEFPSGIATHSCDAISSNGDIYCFDGDGIYKYVSSSDSLYLMNSGFPSPRYRFSCAESQNSIYCFGGFYGVINNNEITRYTPGTGGTLL